MRKILMITSALVIAMSSTAMAADPRAQRKQG